MIKNNEIKFGVFSKRPELDIFSRYIDLLVYDLIEVNIQKETMVETINRKITFKTKEDFLDFLDSNDNLFLKRVYETYGDREDYKIVFEVV